MWRSIAVAVLTIASLPLLAQVHGVPPSVTSIGPGGISTAPPPSVTSMGPFGWQVPRGKFFLNNPAFFPATPGFHGGFHPGRRHGGGTVAMPYYVPYPLYVYPDEAYDDTAAPVPENPEQPGVMPYGTASAAPVPYQPAAPAPAPSAPEPAPAPAAPAAQPPEQETTILVFRDGHRMELTDYAIVGKELINLSGKGPRRIPLADLDLPATTQLNEDRGVSFQLPSGQS